MAETFDQLRQTIEACAQTEGVTSLYMMSLPEAVRKLLNKLIRTGALTLSDLAGELGLTADEARQLMELMEAKGFVTARAREGDSVTVYRVRLARTRELGALPPVDQ